jgi:anhydro-N-acetylmuramic acid kinase
MSGTSLDGIDVAVVDIVRKRGGIRIAPVALHSTPYPKLVREALLAISNSTTHTATIARLNFLLGELYALALVDTCRRARVRLGSVELCGMHGQTIFHEGSSVRYLGCRVASTLQIGEAAVVAERTGIRVISNFRERDIAAGGQGAPLVPYVDCLLFRDRHIDRVALNIGGIANITVIPAGKVGQAISSPASKVKQPTSSPAFDTGPGNMVIDALVARHTQGRRFFDRDGRIARSGKVDERLLKSLLRDPYLALPPPKSCGREQYGPEFVDRLIATKIPLPDLIATATEFAARSIAWGVGLGCALAGTESCALDEPFQHCDRRFQNRDRKGAAIASSPPSLARIRNQTVGLEPAELIVSGGGVHNRFLMQRLRAQLPRFAISTSDAYGIDPDAKEAIAFAILAYEHVHGRPGNLPSATGAQRAVVLGKSSPAS